MGGDLFCNSSNPCSNCQGDCNFDADGKGDMKCYQRNDGDPGPPGCGVVHRSVLLIFLANKQRPNRGVQFPSVLIANWGLCGFFNIFTLIKISCKLQAKS